MEHESAGERMSSNHLQGLSMHKHYAPMTSGFKNLITQNPGSRGQCPFLVCVCMCALRDFMTHVEAAADYSSASEHRLVTAPTTHSLLPNSVTPATTFTCYLQHAHGMANSTGQSTWLEYAASIISYKTPQNGFCLWQNVYPVLCTQTVTGMCQGSIPGLVW